MKQLSNGQLATSATAILSPNDSATFPLPIDFQGGRLAVHLYNNSATTQTVVLTQKISNGTSRHVYQLSLPQNYSADVGVAMGQGDTLYGTTTTASQVDFMISDSSIQQGVTVYNTSGNIVTSVASVASTITASSANALAVGPAGTTSPTFNVDSSTASAVTGVDIVGAASGAGVALKAIGGNNNENLTVDAVGSGVVTIAGSSTGGANVRVPVHTVVGAGTTISNATNTIVEGFTYVTAANNATNCVKLPAGAIGMQVTLVNTVQTATLGVFPQVNNAINNLANNAIYNIPNGGMRTFYYAAAGQWYSSPQTID